MSKLKVVKIIFYSILTTVAFSLDYHIVEDDVIRSLVYINETLYGTVSSTIYKLLCAVDFREISSTALILISSFVYRFNFCVATHGENGSWRAYEGDEMVMGILMSLTYLFGKSFHEFGTAQILVTGWTQIIKAIIVFIGSLLFFMNMIKAVKTYLKSNLIWKIENEINTENRKIYRIRIFLIFIAVWSIYLVAYYPGMFMGDTEDTIYMAFNYHCELADSVELISNDVLLVDHHSALHTIIVGMFIKVGRMIFKSDNLGIFIYVFFQMIFTAWILAHALCKLKTYGVSVQIRMFATVFFCLFPWIPKYAITITKDTLFVDFLLLYLIELLDIINNSSDTIQKASKIKLSVYAILIFLFRKNGLYVVLLSLPFLVKINKKWFWSVGSIMLTIILTKGIYSNIILPAANITDGSIRESLSVPLQQTGRYLKYYADEVTDKERTAIDAVVSYDIILNAYSANSSDPIKNNWRKEATIRDVMNYIFVWAEMLTKHPGTYIAATANNYYAYFYPVVTDLYRAERTSAGSIANANRDGYFSFENSDAYIACKLRLLIGLGNMLWMKMPLMNLFCTCALYVWILIFVWIRSCVKKDKKLQMVVIPLLILVLTILAGPMNGLNYDRYVYPLAVCMPIVLGYGMRCFNE